MLYPEIQKGKVAMKIQEFQQDIGGTAGYTKIIIWGIKGCGQLPSNGILFSYSWFSGAKTAEEASTEGVDYWSPVKTRHKGFCLATLEKLRTAWPVGFHIVMNSARIVPGERPIMAIGHTSNYWKVLIFLLLRGAKVLNQVIHIYLASLKFILMFLFTLLYVIAWLTYISVPVI